MYRELDQLRIALRRYITSTYHLSNPTLVELRDNLLNEPGTIYQEPYLESTPRYDAPDAKRYADLDLPEEVRELFTELGKSRVVFDPPYKHQSLALEATSGATPKDLVVTTGTGSGKTETFLLPALARLAREASASPKSFNERAVRVLLLYPMNALVNDQLGRLRGLLGAPQVTSWFTEKSGRVAKFGRYTGKALYPGARKEDTSKHSKKLESLKFYADLETKALDGDEAAIELHDALCKHGKWPAKPSQDGGSLGGFTEWFGRGHWKDSEGYYKRTIERPGDPELLIRQECHEASPDLLITNYSMLEYMLLRPVERGIFASSRAYYEANPNEKLLLVLDEAHLYRGAQGTEVALLIRRLCNRLGLPPERLQVICTSASFSDAEAAARFAAQLSGKSRENFEVLRGEKVAHEPSGPGDEELARLLAGLELSKLRGGELRERVAAIAPLLAGRKDALEATTQHISGPRNQAVSLTLLSQSLEETVESVILDSNGKGETAAAHLLVLDVDGADGQVVCCPKESPTADKHESLFSDGSVEFGEGRDPIARILYQSLEGLPVTGRLLNLTTGAHSPEDLERDKEGSGPAQAITALGERLFRDQGLPSEIERAATDALVELTSLAKTGNGRPLLAARAHAFFRGLPGLWACSATDCSELPEEKRGGPTGMLYSQPRRSCGCGARIFELYSCRNCGRAFFKSYSTKPDRPDYLYEEDLGDVDDLEGVIEPLYLALEAPEEGGVITDLEVQTGRLWVDAAAPEGAKTRVVWRPDPNKKGDDGEGPGAGKFVDCPCCGATGGTKFKRYPIQDHVTKGDEPFQSLVSTQLLEQPPQPGSTTPLRGRKALLFSDGRQAASRLAGRLGQFSLRDSIRPLLLTGLKELEEHVEGPVTLKHAYVAVLVGCLRLGVNLRLSSNSQLAKNTRRVERLLASKATVEKLEDVTAHLSEPEELVAALSPILGDPFTGAIALGLGAPVPILSDYEREDLEELPAPPIPGLGEQEARLALLDLWLTQVFQNRSLLVRGVPGDWIDSEESPIRLRRFTGGGGGRLEKLVGKAWYKANLGKKSGKPGPWLDYLFDTFGSPNPTSKGYLLAPSKVRLALEDELSWARCERCTSVQPVLKGLESKCIVGSCGGEAAPLDTSSDPVFRARKGTYRAMYEKTQAGTSFTPHPYIAKEHSGALSGDGSDSAIGYAEWHELGFQDLVVEGPEGESGSPVDILSCTTTMEVGIDIGSLTAVALRNVPPGRANYQQRAGRAGRRGASLATVLTYCDSDPHDQRFFRDPGGMVSGAIPDPALKLDNLQIFERHASALLLSLYQQEAIPTAIGSAAGSADLFNSLGLLSDFRKGAKDAFSFLGLEAWLEDKREELNIALLELAPIELGDLATRKQITEAHGQTLLKALTEKGAGHCEEPPQEEKSLKLLDRLMETGLLPRYAFPIDVVSFTVFSPKSDQWRAIARFSPTYGLNQALSSYAPGRAVWVNGEKHFSFALYAPYGDERFQSWQRRKVYSECHQCGYAINESQDNARLGESQDCPACHSKGSLGPGAPWIRPPGFCHPPDVSKEQALSEGHRPTRATHAKLSTALGSDAVTHLKTKPNDGAYLELCSSRQSLLVTNVGSKESQSPGFRYCSGCGRAEPNGWDTETFTGGSHKRPYPNVGKKGIECTIHASAGVVLGNEFLTDIALLRLALGETIHLKPGSVVSRLALTTLANALSIAAAKLVDVEQDAVQGEYRVALSKAGGKGKEVEVFLYDLAPGGAGFVSAAAGEKENLIKETLKLLKNCTCESSCYNCLRSYQNKWDHANLDRHIGAALLEACFLGTQPSLPEEVEDRLLSRLAQDLRDSGEEVLEEPGRLCLPKRGEQSVVLGHPLRPTSPGSARAEAFAGATVIDQLTVERALPAASQLARRGDTPPAPWSLPSTLVEDSEGIPVYKLEDLGEGLESATVMARVSVEGAPLGAFITELTCVPFEAARDQRPKQGEWLVWDPTMAEMDGAAIHLLVSSGVAFASTQDMWTVGCPRPRLGADDKIKVNYASKHKAYRSQVVDREALRSIGHLFGTIRFGTLQPFEIGAS